MDDECKYFLWDCDWYCCDLKDKDIDPNECRNCSNYIRKDDIK